VSFDGFAQGTTYHIAYYDDKQRNFQDDIETVLQNFDNSVSTYNPNSIITKVNNNIPVKLDEYFITCFKKAKEVWKNTDGAFDPTVYPLVNAYGFGPGKKMKLDKPLIDSILQFVGFDLIKIKRGKIIKKDNRVGLDFNAFAQGYSVDVVSRFLNSKGIKAYIVEIGGEVFAKGKKPNGENWTAGIEQPVENQETKNSYTAIVKLENMAVSTSGNYRKFYEDNGVKYTHHIDPKTGLTTKNNLLSASLFAKKCITTDANATGILVMGLEKAKIFLSKHPEIQAYLIYSDEKGNYRVYETPKMKDIILDKK
jgi:thiamine biosynthesis lipoprotein